MKNDFKMNYSEEDFIKLSKSLLATGFIGRIMAYLFVFFFLFILIVVLSLSLGSNDAFSQNTFINSIILLLLFFIIPSVLFFLFEKFNIQKTRKKLGLSLYKNVQKELLDIATEVRVAREKKAFEINGVNQGVDKNDIGYWHGLLKSGAITEEEYEAKKKELL